MGDFRHGKLNNFFVFHWRQNMKSMTDELTVRQIHVHKMIPIGHFALLVQQQNNYVILKVLAY